MNLLLDQIPEEVSRTLAKYPPNQKRSAIMPLLYLAQRRLDFINKSVMKDIAEICEVTPTEVASIVGYYSLYHDHPAGKYRIQVCTDLPCALRGADQFLAGLCERLGIQPGETTPDGLITVEEVKCLAACDKAPMFQVQDRDGMAYRESQTVDVAMALIDDLRRQHASQGVSNG